jgi:carbonic anhydrase
VICVNGLRITLDVQSRSEYMELRRILRAVGVTALFSALLAAQQTSKSESAAAPASPHEKHWGYVGNADVAGPAEWGSLAGASTCSSGHQQSPINLPTRATAQKTSGPKFAYQPTKLSMVNNGHTIQMNTDPGNTITVDGKTYRLAQFHFHAPSEHTVDGRHYPLEIHLVHVDEANRPAVVVGILVRTGKEDTALDTAFRRLPESEGEKADLQAPMDLPGLPPQSGGFWHYAGSLTTPPCTEGIQWFVMESSIAMSRAQISAFTGIPNMDETARPVQATGDRKLERVGR